MTCGLAPTLYYAGGEQVVARIGTRVPWLVAAILAAQAVTTLHIIKCFAQPSLNPR